ncbi:MAG: hypothetical protein AKCLJLPJ_00138 [Fimbriimonadales bacterium]|nr:hypothetical protein [Fimbriimonadales bacterium]
MSEQMEAHRIHEGPDDLIETEHIRIKFQKGSPQEVGINGCRIEDVIEILVQRLLDYQGREFACEENALALEHLEDAREALLLRRRRREEQGVYGRREKHVTGH